MWLPDSIKVWLRAAIGPASGRVRHVGSNTSWTRSLGETFESKCRQVVEMLELTKDIPPVTLAGKSYVGQRDGASGVGVSILRETL